MRSGSTDNGHASSSTRTPAHVVSQASLADGEFFIMLFEGLHTDSRHKARVLEAGLNFLLLANNVPALCSLGVLLRSACQVPCRSLAHRRPAVRSDGCNRGVCLGAPVAVHLRVRVWWQSPAVHIELPGQRRRGVGRLGGGAQILQEVHLATDPARLPLHTHVLRVWTAGLQAVSAAAGSGSHRVAPRTLQPSPSAQVRLRRGPPSVASTRILGGHRSDSHSAGRRGEQASGRVRR